MPLNGLGHLPRCLLQRRLLALNLQRSGARSLYGSLRAPSPESPCSQTLKKHGNQASALNFRGRPQLDSPGCISYTNQVGGRNITAIYCLYLIFTFFVFLAAAGFQKTGKKLFSSGYESKQTNFPGARFGFSAPIQGSHHQLPDRTFPQKRIPLSAARLGDCLKAE